jgi:hypothetical protein
LEKSALGSCNDARSVSCGCAIALARAQVGFRAAAAVRCASGSPQRVHPADKKRGRFGFLGWSAHSRSEGPSTWAEVILQYGARKRKHTHWLLDGSGYTEIIN